MSIPLTCSRSSRVLCVCIIYLYLQSRRLDAFCRISAYGPTIESTEENGLWRLWLLSLLMTLQQCTLPCHTGHFGLKDDNNYVCSLIHYAWTLIASEMEILVLELLLTRFLYQWESMSSQSLIKQERRVISAHMFAVPMYRSWKLCLVFSSLSYTMFRIGGDPVRDSLCSLEAG